MMEQEHATDRCLLCERGQDEIPLIQLRYRDAGFSVCPQHLPVLIHDPGRLIGKLPGAETFDPADHRD